MKKQTILSILISTIIVEAAAEPAMAYVLLSPRRSWASTPIAIRVYTGANTTINDGDGGVTAVTGAIKAWGIVSASTTNQRAVRGQAPVTIELNSNGKICTGSCLAATLTGYYSGSTIYDADVYTNTRYSFTSSRETDGCSGEFDIDGIMVHEVGHVIGIGHSDVAGATMYPSVGSCNYNNRTLEPDDTAAKNDRY
ncbi:MAG TPA: matrixin family metalloprotease [Thermoanaerobaculia bacterium]|nr:matrixin family metalloprotease [Thermoanaerobaculia bacterium]